MSSLSETLCAVCSAPSLSDQTGLQHRPTSAENTSMFRALLCFLFLIQSTVWAASCHEQYVVADIEMQKYTFQHTEHGTFFAMPDHFSRYDQDKLNSMCREAFGQSFSFRQKITVSRTGKRNAVLDFAINTLGMDLSFLISRQQHQVTLIRNDKESIYYGCSMKLPSGSQCNQSHLRHLSRRPASLGSPQSLASLSFSGLSMQQTLPLQYMD